jgi:hypothetical protein
MTVRVNKSSFNIREKLSELERPIGLKGSELMRAETAQEARDLVGAGRKNLIINGGFDVWQRGTSFLSNNTIRYTADRWQVYGVSTSVLDITRQTFSPGQTEVEGNPQYYIRLDNTPDADTTWLELFQRIEDVTYFSNISVTLSFWIKSNRNFSGKNYFTFQQNFGSGGSSSVSTSSSYFDISTSWEKKTLTVTLPSISGKTIGTGSYLEIHLLQTSGVQADTFYDIAQVQLEVGRNATEFEHRSYGEELALCQRYFWIVPNARWLNGYKRHDSQVYFQLDTPVPMRTSPTPTITSVGVFTNHQTLLGGAVQTTSEVFEYRPDSGRGTLRIDSTYTGTHVTIPSWEAGTIEFSAEL